VKKTEGRITEVQKSKDTEAKSAKARSSEVQKSKTESAEEQKVKRTEELKPILRGWINYFRIAEVKTFAEDIDGASFSSLKITTLGHFSFEADMMSPKSISQVKTILPSLLALDMISASVARCIKRSLA